MLRHRGCRAKVLASSFGVSLVVFGGARARAAEREEAPKSASIVYARAASAASCPDEETLRAAVQSRLGYEPFRDGAKPAIRVLMSRSEGAFRADLAIAGGGNAGERVLTSRSDDCDEVFLAMTLAVAIAIDPMHGGDAPPTSADLLPTAVESVPPLGTGDAAPASATRDEPSSGDRVQGDAVEASAPLPAPRLWSFRALVAGALAYGAAPGATVGGLAGIGARYGPVSLDVEGRIDAPSRESLPSPQRGTVTAAFAGATLAPCAHFGIALACPVFTVGELRGEGSDIEKPRRDHSLFATAGLRGGVEIPVAHRFRVRVHGEAAYVLTPTTLRLDGGAAWESGTTAFALAAGMVFQ